jgi:hypothetical protein
VQCMGERNRFMSYQVTVGQGDIVCVEGMRVFVESKYDDKTFEGEDIDTRKKVRFYFMPVVLREPEPPKSFFSFLVWFACYCILSLFTYLYLASVFASSFKSTEMEFLDIGVWSYIGLALSISALSFWIRCGFKKRKNKCS